MSKELKPCPFCGTGPSNDPHPVAVACYHSEQGWSVLCEECMTEGRTLATKDEAIAAWNTRTSHLPDIEDVAKIIRDHVEARFDPPHNAAEGMTMWLKGDYAAADRILSLMERKA